MIFALLSLLSFLIQLFLGFNLTVFNGTRRINRVLAVFCYGGALIGLGELLIFFSPTLERALFLGNFVAPWPIIQAAFLHFILIFTRVSLGRSKLFLILHYTIAATMAVLFYRYIHIEKPLEYFQGFSFVSPITTEFRYSIIVIWVTAAQAASFIFVVVFTLTQPKESDIRRQGRWLIASMVSIFVFAVLLHTIKLTLFPTMPEMTGTQYLLFGVILYIGIRKGNLLDLLPHQVADRILYTMDEIVIITDSNFKVLRINAAAESRFPQLEGDDRSIDLKEVIKNVSSDTAEHFLFAERDFVRRNIRFTNQGGKTRWYSFSRTRVRKSFSRLNCFVFVGSDITNLKESIEEREILLAEIHHRVGNNLQLLLSLINMKLPQIDEEKTLEVIRGLKDFIYAMSSVHRVLYETEKLNAVPLEEYLREVYTDFIRNNPVVPSMEASFALDEYFLDISTSLQVALFFIESLRIILSRVKFFDEEKSLGILISREDSALVISYTSPGLEKLKNLTFEEGLSGLLLNILDGSITYAPDADKRENHLEVILNPPM
ncbi:MAG: histidine kinase dimerization/phosphoacceptor domain -containing protein [Spirochaetia bacterium]